MRAFRRIWGFAAILSVLLLAFGGLAAAVLGGDSGRIGPNLRTTANGRLLHPPGRLVQLGNFPTGGALTPDGRFYWTVSTGRGLNDVRIVAVHGTRVIQTLRLPGASGGIAIDGARSLAYVSGIPDSTNTDEQQPGLPGRSGDVIHVFHFDKRTGLASETGTIPVPPPASAPVPQNFPPKTSGHESWPDRLAVSPDGQKLLVPLNLADAAAVIDTTSQAVQYVSTGPYPYGAAILPGGHTGLVSNEGAGTVSVIDLDNATKVKDIQVGANHSHPEGIAVSPDGSHAYVAIANEDQVAFINTSDMALEKVVSVQRPDGGGESPVALAVTPDGRRLAVAEAAADELSVFALPSGELLGRIPTAAYPADVQTTRNGLTWIASKGFGAGPNPNGPNPLTTDDNNLLDHPGSAVLVTGTAGILRLPSDGKLRHYTALANRQIIPTNAERAPADTPLRPGGPIKHVFFVVRENRTYDQVLGDDPRGDADPALTLFGKQITPNMHALVSRFPLLDHVYANSEASIDGHFWTSAAATSDYTHKNWQPNYAGRNRPYDFGAYTISWPGTGFLFDRAAQQSISYANYGELIAGVVPQNILSLFGVTDKDAGPADAALEAEKFSHSKVGFPFDCYPPDVSIATDSIAAALGQSRETYDSSLPAGAPPNSESRFSCFQQNFEQQLSTDSVPAFNYLVLPSDHTSGVTPGQRTPQSMVAENDYGLGQVVDLISHSKIWNSSAIFVIEDDSQDGADHVDAHRMPAGVFSPYAKPGAVISTRYDMLSFIRSIELILGMRPLGVPDAVATPMYNAFQSKPENSAPFDVISPTYPLLNRNADTPTNAALTAGRDFVRPDQVPQDVFDRILWHSVHGANSKPPPPGPNADKGE